MRYTKHMDTTLLNRIKQVFPNDSTDDIIEWYCSALEYDQPTTVAEYEEYRQYDESGKLKVY